MYLKLIVVLIVTILNGNTFVSADVSQFLPNFQEEWFKYLRDPNRISFRSEECDKQVTAMMNSLQLMEDWAMQMFDANSKLQSGIFQGNLIDFGGFDQCLKVRHISKDIGLVKGQHCMVFTNVDLIKLVEFIAESMVGSEQTLEELAHVAKHQQIMTNVGRTFNGFKTETREEDALILSMGFGTCLPAACTPREVTAVVNSFLQTSFNLTAKEVQDSHCNKDETIEFTGVDIACITLFSLIGLLMVLSTLYDVIKQFVMKDDSPPKIIFLAFSVWSNGKKLFAVNPVDSKSKGDTLHCIHGLRSLSMMWVMFCHRYSITMLSPFRNAAVLPEWFGEYYSPIVSGGTLSVDTFFVLSGLLLGYIFLKTVTKTGKFNVPLFYLHRYLRLTPPFAAMILFHASLLYYFGSGPYWKPIMGDSIRVSCGRSWWTNLIYLNNYVRVDEQCHGPGWYMSVDTQLFVLSPLLLVPLWKWAKAGVALGVSLILASLGIVFAITYVNDFGGAPYSLTGTDMHTKLLYIPTHARFGPWVLGILLGYFLHVYRNTQVNLNWLTVILGWLAATALFLIALFGVYPFTQFGEEQDLLLGAFYQTFSRIAWSLSICWIIFACTYGYGGPVNWFLSISFWQPISRLSFCLYICHSATQMTLQFSQKQTAVFTDFNMIYKFWGDFGISITVAVIWCLAFESPVTVLEKVLFHRNDESKIAQLEKENEVAQLVSSNNVSGMENGTNEATLLESGNINTAYVDDVKS